MDVGTINNTKFKIGQIVQIKTPNDDLEIWKIVGLTRQQGYDAFDVKSHNGNFGVALLHEISEITDEEAMLWMFEQ